MLEQDLFEIEDGVLKAYNGEAPDVVIPEGVTAIGEDAFKGKAWLKSVVLPQSLKTIGPSAFKGCRRMRTPVFPESLCEVGEYAFNRCHDIEELVFPASVTKVGSYAFLYCDGLKKVVLEGPTSFGRATFSHNLALREIALNRDIDDSNFNDEVFEGCVCLEKISLSGEVYEITNLIEAMASDSSYPKVIRSIARSVFHSLRIEDRVLESFNINLKSIVLPEGIKAIGKACFFDKKGIENITLPMSLTEIRANAFLNCTGLEEIVFRNENVSLDPKAFRGCNNLKRAVIGGKTFSLEEVPENPLASLVRDQVLGDFYISGRELVRYLGDEEQIRIPNEVEIIGERCFAGNERLKVVTCPEGLTKICEQAFAGCVGLTTVTLSDKLKRVEREAFAECRKLQKCNIPASVEYIGEYAFRRCSALPDMSERLANAHVDPYAFYKAQNYSGREQSLCKPTGESYGFTVKENVKTLHLSDLDSIERYAYAACGTLEEIVIDAPGCVVGREAFSRCPNLKKVTLNVKELREGAFSYCRNLESVRVSGVSALPAECFAGCYALCDFSADGLTELGARCFDECLALDSFDLSGVGSIGERAFERCDSLMSVCLDKVSCGFHAFADCASLKKVTFTEKTEFASGVFIGCTQLESIVYKGTEYHFNSFPDSLNHAGNTLPGPVREVVASVYKCFEIIDKKILTGYTRDASVVTVPEDIEEIGQDVFRDHIRLKDIRIPASVRLFGSHAFSNTCWLDDMRKKNVFVIVNGVLLDGAACRGRVVLPSAVDRVASWAFAGNIDITELVIPLSRISIESLSFRNCLNLRKITDWNGDEYRLENVSDPADAGYPELIARIFSECINCFKLDGNGNLVESTGNITRLTFPKGIKSIGDGVYKDCHLLETIALSDEIKSIGRSAFENSKWLKTVTNAGGVERVGALAFSCCQSLTSIDLSESLTELGNRCFEHCAGLGEIHLSNRLQKIPERAFFRCKSLKKLEIPASVKEVGPEAFAFCDELEDVRIPAAASVSSDAFAFSDKVRITRY